MRRLQLIVGVVGLGLVAGAITTAPASSGAVKPATRSFLVAGAETPRPQLEQVLTAGRRDGLSEMGAIDRWLSARGVGGRSASTAAHLDNLSDAEVQDLRAYAVQQGQPFSSVARQYGSQEEFQAASWRLEELFPDSYAGMRFRDQGDVAWMGFNGTVPPEALALIRKLPGNVRVEVGHLLPKAKWGQYVTAAQRRVNAIAARSVVRFDSQSQQLVVEVSPSTRASDATIASSVRDALPGTAVAVRRTPMTHRELEDSTMRGGGFLETTGGTAVCTAGFVIRGISTGLKRLSTAAHCIGPLGGLNGTARYELLPLDGGNATPITLMWKVPGAPSPSLPDLAYVSHGSFTPYPSFYITNFDKREVHTAAQGRADVGTLLCHWGRSTHNQECGHVTDSVRNVNEACCVTTVNGNEAAHIEGDSGGPWYYGYMAFGIHHGGVPNSLDASFTPVHMLNDYGLEVWTTP